MEPPRPPISSTPPERAWRAVLMDATLGLQFVSLGLVLVSSALRPRPGFDFLFWCIFGYAAAVGVAWRWRRLPITVRGAIATVPAIPVAYVLWVRGGFLPNVPLAGGVIAAMLAVWFGSRTSIVFNGAFALACLFAGYQVAVRGVVVIDATADPHNFANWARAAFVTLLMSTVLAVTMGWVMTRVELHLEERTAANRVLRHLYSRLDGAKEEERRHLARELHDELGQVLTALRIRIQLARKPPSDSAAPNLEDAVSLVDQLIRQVRKLSVDLSPPLLAEAGLAAAVRAHVEGHPGLDRIATELELECPERLPQPIETAAFRVVQEALTNVVRHSGATRVSIAVRSNASYLFVSIKDDGHGFDVAEALRAAARGERFGFAGMRERVRGLGGRFNVESRPGRGAIIDVRLPVASTA